NGRGQPEDARATRCRDRSPGCAPSPRRANAASLYRYRRTDRRQRIVSLQREVLVAEREEVLHGGIQAHHRQWPWGPGELLTRLLEVIEVQVGIAQGMDEFAGLEA